MNVEPCNTSCTPDLPTCHRCRVVPTRCACLGLGRFGAEATNAPPGQLDSVYSSTMSVELKYPPLFASPPMKYKVLFAGSYANPASALACVHVGPVAQVPVVRSSLCTAVVVGVRVPECVHSWLRSVLNLPSVHHSVGTARRSLPGTGSYPLRCIHPTGRGRVLLAARPGLPLRCCTRRLC